MTHIKKVKEMTQVNQVTEMTQVNQVTEMTQVTQMTQPCNDETDTETQPCNQTVCIGKQYYIPKSLALISQQICVELKLFLHYIGAIQIIFDTL